MRWLLSGIVWSLALLSVGAGRMCSCPAETCEGGPNLHPAAEVAGTIAPSPAQRLQEYRQVCRALHALGLFLQRELFYQQPLTGTQLNQLAQQFREFARASAELRDFLRAVKPEPLCFHARPLASLEWLAIQTVAAEEFRAVCELLFHQPELRRLIYNLPRKEGENIFWPGPLPGHLLSTGTGQEVAAAIGALQAWKESEDAADILSDPKLMGWLDRLTATASWRMTNQGEKIDSIFSLRSFRASRRDIAVNALRRTIGGSVINAAVIGALNLAGRIHGQRTNSRPGRKIIQQMDSLPQPLDLVLQKRYFTIGNYLVPGYWQHTAVWLGTREQLQELGLWRHPALEPWRETIEQGRIVYEFRYNGLNLTAPEIFFQADELAILRVNSLDWQGGQEVIAEIYRQLAEQRDKQYDYGFNLKALDRVTCTDIIFLAFGDINWPRKSLYGRPTMLPDHVAELVFHRNSPLEFIAFYKIHGRQKIHGRLRGERKSMEALARTVDFFADTQSDDTGNGARTEFVRRNHRRKLAASFEGGTLWLRLRRRTIEARPRYVEAARFGAE